MDARPGNRTPQKPLVNVQRTAPRDRRLPLASIVFKLPKEVPGCTLSVRRLAAGEKIPQTDFVCPPLFFDPELRLLMVGEYLIPVDGGDVSHFTRATAAITPKAS